MPNETIVASRRDCAPHLTPKLAPWMRNLIEKPGVASAWLSAYGSPLHVVVESEFKRNIKDLRSPLQDRGVAGSVFFARKANKLPWFVSLAKQEGIGVDTASLQEVKETLALGVPPSQVVITAIGKKQELVDIAVREGCLLIIDNIDELDQISATAAKLNMKARIGLRLAGFEVLGTKVFSRFGLPFDDHREIISTVDSKHVSLEFLHAHLDRYDTTQRAIAGLRLVEAADYAAQHGHSIKGIDLGGGIVMRYLDSKEQWDEFNASLLEAVKGERPSFTYLEDGLGYHRVKDEIIGKPDLYPAWNDMSKERFIAAVLDYCEGGTPFHKQLSQRGIGLYFEPGRALLDNVGMTLATVTFRKRDTLGNLLVGFEMNRMNLRPFRAEYCCDPILPANNSRPRADEGVYFVGNLCSESDLIYRRKLDLPYIPEREDFVFFANTAGYLAHHMEIGTHGNPLPKNLLIDPTSWEVKATV